MEKLVEVLVLEGIAVLMFVFAYAIGVKGRMDLIAGYSEKTAARVHNKPGLARLIARLCLLIGIVSALMPLATWLWGTPPGRLAMLIGAYGGFIVGTAALAIVEAREFAS